MADVFKYDRYTKKHYAIDEFVGKTLADWKISLDGMIERYGPTAIVYPDNEYGSVYIEKPDEDS